MKVILLKKIDRLGNIGDIINVKEGYARNYLIPNKAAKEASAGNVKWIEALKKKEAEENSRTLDAAKQVAQKLAELTISIAAQAGEEDKLFGSVSNDMIAAALSSENIKVDKRDIVTDEPIKKLGTYQVTVKVHPEVKAALKVIIVKK